jgi:Mg/Co/Ni transporter MgtE
VTAPEAPDLRLDELKELAEQDDLHPFLLRVRHVHPSDLADVLSALEQSTRVHDVTGLVIYFSVASVILRGTLL